MTGKLPVELTAVALLELTWMLREGPFTIVILPLALTARDPERLGLRMSRGGVDLIATSPQVEAAVTF
jgi:hypothetical protein